MDRENFKRTQQICKDFADEFGSSLIEVFHYLALFVIGGSIFWSAIVAFSDMIGQGKVTIGDILLLFIYLELGAMVSIYFKTNLMPVRSLIFIAITAMARLLIADIQAHHQVDISILMISAAILLLALSTLIIRNPSGDS